MKKVISITLVMSLLVGILGIIPVYSLTESNGFNVENGTLTTYTGSEKNVVIPSYLGITSIGRNCFISQSIESVVIPEEVTSILHGAFESCTSLKYVKLPYSMRFIDQSAFNVSDAGVLNAVCPIDEQPVEGVCKIPEGVGTIIDFAFGFCKFSSVIFPSTLNKIDNTMIAGSTIITATFYCTEPSFKKEDGNWYSPLTFEGKIVDTVYGYVGSTVEDWAKNSGQALNFVALTEAPPKPDDTEDTGDTSDKTLDTMTFTKNTTAEQVMTAAKNSYPQSSGVTSIEWVENWSVTPAFNGVKFGYNQILYPGSSGYGCGIIRVHTASGYTDRIIQSEIKPTMEDFGYLETSKDGEFYIQDNVLIRYDGSAKIVNVPQGVKYIDDMAFNSKAGIVALIIPEGVTRIGMQAFANMRDLNVLVLPQSLTTLASINETGGGFIASRCPNLRYICVSNDAEIVTAGIVGNDNCISSRFSQFYVSSNTKYLGNVAFYYTSISRMFVPNNIKSIGEITLSNIAKDANIYISSKETTAALSAFDRGDDGVTNVYIPSNSAINPTDYEGKTNVIFHTWSQSLSEAYTEAQTAVSYLLTHATPNATDVINTVNSRISNSAISASWSENFSYDQTNGYSGKINLTDGVNVLTIVLSNPLRRSSLSVGDVNSDNIVNQMDITALKQYLEKKNININIQQSDLNGDGTINSADADLLEKALSNEPCYSLNADLRLTDMLSYKDNNSKDGNAFFIKKSTTNKLVSFLEGDVQKKTGNTDVSGITGKIFYISNDGNDQNDGLSPDKAWKTIRMLCNEVKLQNVKSGDAVLLRCGDTFRERFDSNVSFEGLTIGSYGSGEKPIINGSEMNGAANPDYWVRVEGHENLWQFTGQYFWLDVGNIVFLNSNGEVVANGYRKDEGTEYELNENWQFCNGHVDNPVPNESKYNLYLYFDGGNPALAYSEIEFCQFGHLATLWNKMKIDNLCFLYGGTHAIQGTNTVNSTVTNCEIGWIGGCKFGTGDQSKLERLGNAIELWDNADNVNIYNNYIYQIYDTGLTFQGGGKKFTNINFSNNIVEYTTAAFEYWLNTGNDGYIDNVSVNNNVFRYIGYGFGDQRPAPLGHAVTSGVVNNNCVDADGNGTTLTFKNNIFNYSKFRLLTVKNSLPNGVEPVFQGNTYVQREGSILGYVQDKRYDFTQEDVDLFRQNCDKEAIFICPESNKIFR